MARSSVTCVMWNYPTMADGTKVPFRPSERPRISPWMRAHILDRHQAAPEDRPEWPTKSKFPAEWNADRILEAVDLTLADPGRPPARYGDKIRFERVVDGHVVRVQVRVDMEPPEIWNAYPVEKEG